MLFYKSLVSFVTAIALASSVTASVAPERRQYTPPNCQVSSGSSTCCTTSTPFTGLSEGTQGGLLGLLGPNLNLNLPIGLDCVLPGTLGCNNNAVCCNGDQSLNGLINLGFNCLTL